MKVSLKINETVLGAGRQDWRLQMRSYVRFLWIGMITLVVSGSILGAYFQGTILGHNYGMGIPWSGNL